MFPFIHLSTRLTYKPIWHTLLHFTFLFCASVIQVSIDVLSVLNFINNKKTVTSLSTPFPSLSSSTLYSSPLSSQYVTIAVCRVSVCWSGSPRGSSPAESGQHHHQNCPAHHWSLRYYVGLVLSPQVCVFLSWQKCTDFHLSTMTLDTDFSLMYSIISKL